MGFHNNNGNISVKNVFKTEKNVCNDNEGVYDSFAIYLACAWHFVYFIDLSHSPDKWR